MNIFFDNNLNQDIVVVDLPPLFGIFFSKEFTTNLGGYLALDCTNLLLIHKDEYVKIQNEGTKVIHVKKISKHHYMNASRFFEAYDQDPLMEYCSPHKSS